MERKDNVIKVDFRKREKEVRRKKPDGVSVPTKVNSMLVLHGAISQGIEMELSVEDKAIKDLGDFLVELQGLIRGNNYDTHYPNLIQQDTKILLKKLDNVGLDPAKGEYLLALYDAYWVVKKNEKEG